MAKQNAISAGSGNAGARSLFRRQALNSIVLLAADAVSLWASLYAGNWALWVVAGTPISIRYSLAIIPAWMFFSFFSGLVPAWGLGVIEEYRRIQWQLAGVFLLAALAYFFSRDYVLPSRFVYVASYVVSTAFVPLGRRLLRRPLAVRRWWGCPIVLYGTHRSVTVMTRHFERERDLGYIPSGIFTDDPAGSFPEGLPVLGSLRDASGPVPIAVADLASIEPARVAAWLDGPMAGYRKVILIPDLDEDFLAWIKPRTLGGLVGLEVGRNLLQPWARALKRLVDVTLVCVLAPLWVPVLLGLALWIRVREPGPVWYRQRRIGKGNRPFMALKFRTMVPDADVVLADLLAREPALREEWERSFKLEKDPRITSVGRWLRRHSLDELPQVLNVLRGDMSLVGPRPLPDYHHNAVSPGVRSPRAQVRPGMTGLWQVSGRSDLDASEMEKWDAFYVRNWSIWLDLVILAKTVPLIIRPRGAY